MATKILSNEPVSADKGLAVVRIVTGLLMAYHGLEIFNTDLMEGYINWDVIKGLPAPRFMVYLGKGLELITGIFLAAGIFTRLTTLIITINMLFICFFVGDGEFYYGDQLPFLFVLLALIFFFVGPGAWSAQPSKK
jgi:putative oxidoreductase